LGYKPEGQSGYSLQGNIKEPNLASLEAMLQEIYRIQFSQDPSRMNANVIRTSYYVDDTGKPFSGHTLLNKYVHARWLQDHPESPLTQKEALNQPGYSSSELVQKFIQETLGYKLETLVDYSLSQGKDYDWKNVKKPHLASLEAMLREIFSLQFAGDTL